MKASTIATTLKLLRSHMEEDGVILIGRYEMIALAITENHLGETSLGDFVRSQISKNPVKLDGKKVIDDLRKAYKHFENLPADKDFTLDSKSPSKPALKDDEFVKFMEGLMKTDVGQDPE